MKLSELFAGAEISETNIKDFGIDIKGVKTDSNEVSEGDIFISLAGQTTDGHRYITEAIERRAAVIVIENKRCSGSFPYIRVPSSRRLYALVWNNISKDPSKDIELIAVTGTNGKSSVVSMISHILETAGFKSAVIGTLNSNLTTPDPPELYPRLRELAENGYKYAVLEASSHALELEKLSMLRFKAGVFTNLTRDHLDFHNTMYSYARAKSKLFDLSDICIYNYDDKYSPEIIKNAKTKKLSFSPDNTEADFISKNIKLGLGNSEFEFLTKGELFHIKTNLTGRYNVSNALCAASCAYTLGVDKKLIKAAFQSFTGIKGRMEQVETESRDYLVFIDYAHTPNALESLLSSLKEVKKEDQRLVCIFGCGGNRDKGKRAEMGAIATGIADFTVITSDNPRNEDPYLIIRDIVSGIKTRSNHLVIVNRKQAIRYAVHSAKKGDILVFCGKGHECYEINGSKKTEFNEALLIKEADKERIEIKGNEYYSRRQNENVFSRDS